jgi:uncharacterized membrane protein YeiH
MLYWLDIFGTFVFAVSGAFKAFRHDLDILGVAVLAVSTGVGGGMIRDVLLGAVPPAAFQDETYLAACLLGALFTLGTASRLARRWRMVMLADGVGLGVFTAIGAAKAHTLGLGPLGVIMMGVMTAAGGGVVRDLLVREVPALVRSDFYATAALGGGLTMVGCHWLGIPGWAGLPLTIGVTIGLRFWAMKKNVSLPRVRAVTGMEG